MFVDRLPFPTGLLDELGNIRLDLQALKTELPGSDAANDFLLVQVVSKEIIDSNENKERVRLALQNRRRWLVWVWKKHHHRPERGGPHLAGGFCGAHHNLLPATVAVLSYPTIIALGCSFSHLSFQQYLFGFRHEPRSLVLPRTGSFIRRYLASFFCWCLLSVRFDQTFNSKAHGLLAWC